MKLALSSIVSVRVTLPISNRKSYTKQLDAKTMFNKMSITFEFDYHLNVF